MNKEKFLEQIQATIDSLQDVSWTFESTDKVLVDNNSLNRILYYILHNESENYFNDIENFEGEKNHIYMTARKLFEEHFGEKHLFAEGTNIVFIANSEKDFDMDFKARIEKVIVPFQKYLIVDQDDNAFEVDFANNFVLEG